MNSRDDLELLIALAEGSVASACRTRRKSRIAAPRRMLIILPVLEMRRLRQMRQRPTIEIGGRTVRTLDGLACALAALCGASRASIWRWVRCLDSHGYSGLRDGPRADSGHSRWWRAHPEIAAYVRSRMSEEAVTILSLHKALCREWPGVKPPSYTTMRLFVNSLRGDHE